MPTIPEYRQQLNQRRQQLETVRSEVASQQFKKPILQQRVLRQLTPFTSLKVRRQIGKMRSEFDRNKQAALGEVEQGFREQEQLEQEFAPVESQYNQYLNQMKEYQEAKAAEKLSRGSPGGAAIYAGVATGSEKKKLQKILKAYKDYLAAPKMTVTLSEQEAQLLPGVIVRDFTKKKMGPEYISPETGQSFASFADLTRSFEVNPVPQGALDLAPVPDYNTRPALSAFALNVNKNLKSFSPSMLGLRPTNINMMGSFGRGGFFQQSLKNKNNYKYSQVGRVYTTPVKKQSNISFFGKSKEVKTKGIRWL